MLKCRGQLMMAPFTSQIFYIPHISVPVLLLLYLTVIFSVLPFIKTYQYHVNKGPQEHLDYIFTIQNLYRNKKTEWLEY